MKMKKTICNLPLLFSEASFLEPSTIYSKDDFGFPAMPPTMAVFLSRFQKEFFVLFDEMGNIQKKGSHFYQPPLHATTHGICPPKRAGSVFSCLLGKIPAHSVSLGTRGVQAGLFSTDPFLWTVSLQAVKKKNSDKLWVVI